MNISFHIQFNGQCQEAFEYYEKVLNGKIGTMMRFEDSPAAGTVPNDWQGKIVHANIKLMDIEIAGADLVPDLYEAPKGFCILLGIDNAPETLSVFNALVKDGSIIMELQQTFWSSSYGIVLDRFGIQWKINGTA